MSINLSFLSGKLLRYGVIGAISTGIHITVAFIWIYTIHPSLFFSNLSGFLIAYTFSYTVQSRFVFQSTLTYAKALKYFIVQIIALMASIVVSDALSNFNPYIKTLIVALILPLFTYFIHTVWTFSSETPKEL
ncbi:MAG TPA: GtrA family protein [Sulfuricurvum sp.]|nr:GtrA family protein [Sulfuricurvum sp.]